MTTKKTETKTMKDFMNDYDIPEEIKDSEEYVRFDELENKEISILNFVIFESQKDIYTEDNKTGVNILLDLDGKVVNTVTHAKAMVRTFENIKKHVPDFKKSYPLGLPTKIVKIKTKNNRDMWSFEF